MDETRQGFLLTLALDVAYWIACFLVFRLCNATLSGDHPLAEALICSTGMIVGREALQTAVCRLRNGRGKK